jgi:hypothetical protein
LVTDTTFRGRTGGEDAAGALAFAAVLIVLAWQQGGYHAGTWTRATICLACLGLAAWWLRGRLDLARRERLMLVACASFAVLLAVSALWSEDPASSLREGKRALLYLVALAAFFVVRPRARFILFALSGALVAIVLLSAPLGYANSVGILAAIGMLLAVAVAAAERGWTRWVALAVLVPLAWQLLATSSRGSCLALAVGLLVRAVLLYLRRFWPALGVVAVIAVIGAVIAASPTNPFGEQRPAYWAVAWHDYESHPGLGSGAGTYALHWRQEHPLPLTVLDAHSLYLETLAEVGPVGLFLLLAALGVPLYASFRNRNTSTVVAFAPAYLAFLVHAGIDWDWEMPVVTLAGLVCGAALLQSPPDETGCGAPLAHRARGGLYVGRALGIHRRADREVSAR